MNRLLNALKRLIAVEDSSPVSVEYVSDYGSGKFVIRSIDRKATLNTFNEHEKVQMKHWLKANCFHVGERFDTVI
jgi:hypothetical protein